jgi:cytochrome b involved in lipid metabolism
MLRHHQRYLKSIRLLSRSPKNNYIASFDVTTSSFASTLCSRMLFALASIVSGGAATGIVFLTSGNTDEHTTLFIPRKALCHGAAAPSSQPPCKSLRERLSEYLSSFKMTEENLNDRDLSLLPEYTSAQVAEHDGGMGSGNCGHVWMSYGGLVYDVTDFIPLHPGGTERIARAAGAAMEPYWYLHQQHFDTQEPMQILQTLVVGRLAQADQDQIDEQLQEMQNEMNRFRLELDVGRRTNSSNAAAVASYSTRSLSLLDLKSLPKTDLVSKVGCAQSSRPTTTSLFGGVLMKDLLVGIVQEEEESSSSPSTVVQSLVFHAMDGETVTVQMDNNDYRDILVAYEENGAPLTHQRGFPLRIIIPSGRGRIVKWVRRIEVRLTTI